jgi:hypothetical protein
MCRQHLLSGLSLLKHDYYFSGIALHNLSIINRFEVDDHNTMVGENSYVPLKKFQLLKEDVLTNLKKELKRKKEYYKRQHPKYITLQDIHTEQLFRKHPLSMMLENSILYNTKAPISYIKEPMQSEEIFKTIECFNPHDIDHLSSFFSFLAAALEILNTGLCLKPESKILNIEEFPIADPNRVRLHSKECIKPILEIAYIYTSNGMRELAEYWVKYALSIAIRYNSEENVTRAQLLLSSLLIDTKRRDQAKSILLQIADREMPINIMHLKQIAKELLSTGGLEIKKKRKLEEQREADFEYYDRIVNALYRCSWPCQCGMYTWIYINVNISSVEPPFSSRPLLACSFYI